jgi:hypothetical protein
MRHLWNAIWSVCRGRLWGSSDLPEADDKQQLRHESIVLVVARLQRWAGL